MILLHIVELTIAKLSQYVSSLQLLFKSCELLKDGGVYEKYLLMRTKRVTWYIKSEKKMASPYLGFYVY